MSHLIDSTRYIPFDTCTLSSGELLVPIGVEKKNEINPAEDANLLSLAKKESRKDLSNLLTKESRRRIIKGILDRCSNHGKFEDQEVGHTCRAVIEAVSQEEYGRVFKEFLGQSKPINVKGFRSIIGGIIGKAAKEYKLELDRNIRMGCLQSYAIF